MPHIADRWEDGRKWREPFIQRAIKAAEVSLPYLAPRTGDDEVPLGYDYSQRFSGRAARGVSTLASKLTVGLFPPTAPFVKLEPDIRVLLGERDPQTRGDIDAIADEINQFTLAFSRRERAIDAFLDSVGFRAKANLTFLHLLISGNVLLRQTARGHFAVYRLDRFQVERDGIDRVRSLMTREVVPIAALPEDVDRQRVQPAGHFEDHTVLYTRAEVVKDDLDDEDAKRPWRVWQELENGDSVGKAREVRQELLPYIPVRLFACDEHYGRGIFDIVQGEVETVEGLTQAIIENAAMNAAGFWRIDPASGVNMKEFLALDSGEGVYAKDGQIGMVRADKGGDMAVAMNVRDTVDHELAQTFLSFTPRDAERVTAQEIQRVSQELNESLAGAYTNLANELQLPVAVLTEERMIRLNKLDRLPDPKLARRRIVTGIDAIGRGREVAALQAYMGDLQATVGPERAAQVVKVGGLSQYLAAAYGIDPERVTYSDEEIDERDQARQQADAVSQNLPAILQAVEEPPQQQ